MRLTLVISSLDTGGAERVMVNLANYWVDHEHQVCLLTFDNGDKRSSYRVDPRVNHIPLALAGHSSNLLAGGWKNVGRVSKLRAAIRRSRPDCVISFLDTTNILTLLATLGTKIPVIVSERSDPASNPPGRGWKWLRAFAYERATRVVAPTGRVLSYFGSSIQSRGCVIPNPVLPAGRKAEEYPDKSNLIISVGRMGREKGFDILLESFAKVRQVHPSWNLMLVGDGPLRKDLESLRDRLGLGDSVKFVGQVTNPEDYLCKADLFVMASRFEGFPNALCEAMACGLPVVHTDCPSGPREIIRDGVDGILVPTEDANALAETLCQLISDEDLRRKLSRNASDITERFGLATVMGQWEELLNDLK